MSKRWSYLTIAIKPGGLMGGIKPETIQAELTRHGNLGWELVNIVVAAPLSAPLLVFKKEA